MHHVHWRTFWGTILLTSWLFASPIAVWSQTKVETFHPNKCVNESFYLIDKQGTRDGQYVRYSPTGRIIELGTYRNGKKTGVWWNFYSNGLVNNLFDYDKNEEVAFDLDHYRLGKNYAEYPPEAKEIMLEGKVEMSFKVDSLCRCSALRIISSTDPIFNASAFMVGEMEMKALMKERNLKCDNREMRFPVKFQLH